MKIQLKNKNNKNNPQGDDVVPCPSELEDHLGNKKS
jgi:hypothetical protein